MVTVARPVPAAEEQKEYLHMSRDNPASGAQPGIGPRLRYWRKRRHLTIDEVAAKSQLSKGFLSQIERDLVAPSIASLILVCEAIGIHVGTLFAAAPTQLIRVEDRPPVAFGGEKLASWLLTPATERSYEAIETEIQPSGGSGAESYALESSSEWVYVLEGALEVDVEGLSYSLSAGDTFTFPPQRLHSWRNPSEETATRALWVLVPPEPR